MKKKISIIIRTKNEERWISQCLSSVAGQKYTDYEIVIVDNESNDKTVEKAKQFNITKIVTCGDYRPGKAINVGLANTSGDFIVCLSGHCIPVNENWLGSLLSNFIEDPMVAGVYGRQEPMSFTSDADKRDLAVVFGLDKKIQIKDSFFHNANSMIRRDVLDKIPFDEDVTNIEDRVWAQKVLSKGYKIIYEPEAGVYHYHGIHQNGNLERCTNVVKIFKAIHSDYGSKTIDTGKLNIVAIIPVRGEVRYLNGKPLVEYTIKRALESKYIRRVIVSTDNSEMVKIAESCGAEAPFIRDPKLSEERVDLDQVLQYSLQKIEGLNFFPDLVVTMEVTFPFRPERLIDDMILQLAANGLDSVVSAKAENKAVWEEGEEGITQLVEGLTPRKFKDAVFIELRGIACVTHPEFLRKGRLLGDKIGIYEVKDPSSYLEVRSEEDFKLAAAIIDRKI